MSYRLCTEDPVDEVHGVVRVYEHMGSGAHVMTVSNSDKNKVFLIAFRTTPQDSTGVAHIMEHSVLCGSRKYPIRDPFVELAKGSLNTFLNALTYPDKTVYPVASVNDKDFRNLMDVYLDAVFYPRATDDERIFRQEGWHYELDEDGELLYNGVVYNEMKGAFSNPDSVLERHILGALFPHTTYAHESGGAPDDIPDLSFEAFRKFHESYYHPSNAYIFLYGDLDMEERLEYLDREYLSHFERIDADSLAEVEEPPGEPVAEKAYYAVAENENEQGRALLSESFCLPGPPTRLSLMSFMVLDYILLSSPGALLREALIGAGIGEDVDGGYVGELRQPYFSVIVRGSDEEKTGDMRAVILDTLSELAANGINKNSLRAALNFLEFKCREEDYGSLPMGLAVGLNVLASWIYGGDPTEYLYYLDAIDELRSLIETDYFEELIRKAFLDNDHVAIVCAVPRRGLSDEKESALRAKLRAYRDSLSSEELEKVAVEAEALRAYQSEPESIEALKCLPVLELGDIEPEAERLLARSEGEIVYSEAETSGIAYIQAVFDTDGLSEEEISLAAFIADILTEVPTGQHSYRDLYDLIMLHTGGISFRIGPYPSQGGGYRGLFTASLRVLDGRIAEGMELLSEILGDSLFGDEARIAELLRKTRTEHKSHMESAMHKMAVMRASSYISAMERYSDLCEGVAYYDFLKGAASLSGEGAHLRRFIRSVTALALRLFDEERLSFSLYGSREALTALEAGIPRFREELRRGVTRREREIEEALSGRAVPGSKVPVMNLSCLNEGLKTASEVNYCAAAGDYREQGLEYHGGLQVLRVMLCYDYLWTRLRVLGGAYGCMAAFGMSGLMYMTSYRDPAIAATYKVYEELSDYLSSWEGSEDSVRKFIIGAIAVKDRPETHSQRAASEFGAYMYGLTDEQRQRERDEILSCTAEDLRGFARYIDALMAAHARCTIGNERDIADSGELFCSVRGLF